MKIIKRNGSEAVFDISKIIAAVTKANNVVASNQRLTKEQITAIADDVARECQSRNHAMNVEEIQDLVEDAIMQTKAYEVARKYITYRYVQSLRRTHNTTDDRILSLIECNNEEVKQENANKNPTVNSVQRDYMAGEVSKDLTMRMLLPAEMLTITPNICTTATWSTWTTCCRTARLFLVLSSKNRILSPRPATLPPRSLRRWHPTSTVARASA